MDTQLSRRGAVALTAGTLVTAALGRTASAMVDTEIVARFPAAEAGQAVAVDDKHFYAIVNSAIGKYDKKTGAKLTEWSGPRDGAIRHMNAGIVLDGVLYCANSNFPETPMASSIEMFDPKSLDHIGSHSFGIDVGSATWIDRRDGHWYVTFAHYDDRGGMPGMDHTYTQMIKYDTDWRRVGGWTFPPEALAKFKPQSNSGGIFGDDGLIYATAHHNEELYVLRFPSMGPVLEMVGTIPNTTEGQGIAWDPSEDRVMWGISRARREVLAWRIPPLPQG